MLSKSFMILAIETSAQACSVAISCGPKVICSRFVEISRGQSEALFPLINEAFADAVIKYKNIDIVAVTRGPGTFTGVRVGLAAAHGISLAGKIPILGATTLELMAFATLSKNQRKVPILSLIATKQKKSFFQIFADDGKPLCQPQFFLSSSVRQILENESLSENKIYVVGDGSDQILAALKSECLDCVQPLFPPKLDASSLALFAINHIKKYGVPRKKYFPEPFYLQPFEAKPAIDGGRLRPR